MINKSDNPINFYRVKAHIGVIGNEFADAIAKHAALHKYGHDETFPPRSLDGKPFAHVYWLAEENNETTHLRESYNTTTKINLAPLLNVKDKLKAHMRKHHRLGDANTNSGNYNCWKRLLTSVNLTTSNSFWSNTRINVSQKRNVMNGYSLHSENAPPLRQSHYFILSVVSSTRQPNPYAFWLSECFNSKQGD